MVTTLIGITNSPRATEDIIKAKVVSRLELDGVHTKDTMGNLLPQRNKFKLTCLIGFIIHHYV